MAVFTGYHSRCLKNGDRDDPNLETCMMQVGLKAIHFSFEIFRRFLLAYFHGPILHNQLALIESGSFGQYTIDIHLALVGCLCCNTNL